MAQTIKGEGPPSAKIAIVAEMPDFSALSTGRPLMGSHGTMLNALLQNCGLDRRQCYITYVVKEKLPYESLYSDKQRTSGNSCLERSRDELYRELSTLGPNVIIALGNEPLKTLTGHSGISKWRGSICNTKWGKVVPTFDPGYLLRVYKDRAIVEMDVRRAKDEAVSRECNLPSYRIDIDPSFSEVMEYLSALQRNRSTFAFDVETFRGSGFIRCLGFATSATEAFVIPFINSFYSTRSRESVSTTTLVDLGSDGSSGLDNRWTLEEEKAILNELWNVFTSPYCKSIAQNFPFDASRIIEQWGIPIRNLYMDTMVAHHCCYSEMPKSLDFLCSIYTRCPRYSDYDSGNDISLWNYNGMDCAVTWECAQRIEEECKSLDVWNFYKRHAEPVMLSLTRAQNRGCLIDTALLGRLTTETEQQLDLDAQVLEKLAGRKVNPNSPKQVKEFLYDTLGMPPVISRKTKTVCADEDSLHTLMGRHLEHAPVIGKILACRKSRKLLSGILSSKLKNDRMVTNYHATGTVTRRLSSSIDIFGYGCNVQNVPGGPIRRLFTCADDEVLIKVDLSQAEARGVAWYAKIHQLIDRYANDPSFDIHVWNAANNIYGIPEEDVTKEQRSTSKPGVHGGNYGLGPRTAARIYDIPYQEAKHVLDSYRNALPELSVWWKEIEKTLLTTRKLRTPTGGLRVFLDRLDETTFRSAYAFLPQSLIGDGIINRAFYLADIILAPYNCYPLLQVHDEIVYQCPKEHLQTCIPLIKEIMEYPVHFPGIDEPLVIPTDISYGPNWYDQQEVK